MAQTFTRQQLFDAVWAEPITAVAKRLGLSDVALRKNCLAMNIPVPERGYWARKRAGQQVRQAKLPERELGQSDSITIGRIESPWPYRDAEVPEPPPLREFPETIEDVRARARKMLGRVTASRDLSNPHRAIAEIMAEDAHRAEKRKSIPYFLDEPRYESREGRRLLRLLNGLFLALARAGAAVGVQVKDPVEWWVRVGNRSVALDVEIYKKRATGRIARGPVTGKKEVHLQIALQKIAEFPELPNVWEDEPDSPIEKKAAEIATEILVAGEMGYRAWVISNHRWQSERYVEYVKKEQAKRDEAERQRKAELLRKAAEKRGRLIRAAKDWRLAGELRAFISAVQAALPDDPKNDEDRALAEWITWANREADQIDPLVSGLRQLYDPRATHPKE